IGGDRDRKQKYFGPTLVLRPDLESPLMSNEIFGPILPVFSYTDESEVEALLERYAKPLAFYLFTRDAALKKRILQRQSFGGGAINDTLVHLGVVDLPFGGIGTSGMGNYHGRSSFDTFSHHKSVLSRG